tara:strand:- start:25 stop:858 length:834 start_codon:yes stop_codon:yes gene_type:complete
MLKQVFIDCMPGPTNHFGGHSFGNVASMKSKGSIINPKKAALEWLEKVKLIHNLGANQCVFPPHRRPLLKKKQINLNSLSSAFIWMANCGHFLPAIDSSEGVHQFIPANLKFSNHRNKEYRFHSYWMNKLTTNQNIMFHKITNEMDEGAANSIRLWNKRNEPGLNIYVYGDQNKLYPSRQKKISINEIVLKLNPHHWLTLKQSDIAIDSGIFHNDVISFGLKNMFFCHENAFKNQHESIRQLENRFREVTNIKLKVIQVSKDQLSLNECVKIVALIV